MHRGCLALLAGLTVAAVPASASGGEAPAPAIPTEAHHGAVDADVYPWSSVVKLFNSVGGACTGAVIAPDRVLTAGHCLYAFRTRRFLPAAAIHVLLGYERGDYRIHARVRRYRLGPGYDPQAERATAASDWAVLELEAPLPAGVRPLRVAEGQGDKAAAMLGGFARDRAYQMTADEHCRITGGIAGSPLIAHDCLTAPGDSGAPLLVRRSPDEVEVVGVAVGIWHLNTVTLGVAAPVSPAILASGTAQR